MNRLVRIAIGLFIVYCRVRDRYSDSGCTTVESAGSGCKKGEDAGSADRAGGRDICRRRPVHGNDLNIALGPIAVDLLGALVALSPVALDLAGVVGTPLGDLVCEVSDLLGNVAAIVNLLNNILALLTGLLGGLTGGIGGIIPMP